MERKQFVEVKWKYERSQKKIGIPLCDGISPVCFPDRSFFETQVNNSDILST